MIAEFKLFDTGLGFKLSMSLPAQLFAAGTMANLRQAFDMGLFKMTDETYMLDVDNVAHKMTYAGVWKVMEEYAGACMEEWTSKPEKAINDNDN
jgi:hypothetical protein